MSNKNTNELIEEVRNADKEIARELVHSGVRNAQQKSRRVITSAGL